MSRVTPLLSDLELSAADVLKCSLPAAKWTLHFVDVRVEEGFQRWQHAVSSRDVRFGLVLCNFLYFLVSIVFAGWSHSYEPSGTSTDLISALDILTGTLLSLFFVASFSSCATQHPQLFASLVLTATLVLVASRAYAIALASSASFVALAPVVTLLMIIVMLFGSVLLQMPFVNTLLVGMLTTAAYGILALVELHDAPDGSGWYPVSIASASLGASIAAYQRESSQRTLFVMHAALVRCATADARSGRPAAVSTDSELHAEYGVAKAAQACIEALMSATSHRPDELSCTADEQPRPSASQQTQPRSGYREAVSPLLAEDAPDCHREDAGTSSSPHADDSGGVLDGSSTQYEPDHVQQPLNFGLIERSSNAMRTTLRNTAVQLANNLLLGVDEHSGASSLGAVQHALHQTGAASLRELLAHEILSGAARLPLPQWAFPANSSAEPRLEEPKRTTFELVTDADLPSWYSPYPFVRSNYRCHFSNQLCISSLFRLHNETVNVWTEFLPAIGFSIWTALFLERHKGISETDRLVVGSGLIVCTVVRPFCSGLAHLLHCTDPTGYIVWWSIDYLSICAAILASSVVYGHFAFYCAGQLQMLFFTSAAGLLSTTIVAVMAVASPALRATSFLLFVLFCNGVPLVYQLFAKLSGDPSYHIDVDSRYLGLWAASLCTFSIGLIVKSSYLPERIVQSPWSDLFLTSHNLWHLILNTGFVLGTFLAWDVFLEWHSEHGCHHQVYPIPGTNRSNS